MHLHIFDHYSSFLGYFWEILKFEVDKFVIIVNANKFEMMNIKLKTYLAMLNEHFDRNFTCPLFKFCLFLTHCLPKSIFYGIFSIYFIRVNCVVSIYFCYISSSFVLILYFRFKCSTSSKVKIKSNNIHILQLNHIYIEFKLKVVSVVFFFHLKREA